MDGEKEDIMDLGNQHCEFEDEEDLASGCSKADVAFDQVVGHIEDIIVDDEFQQLQNNFLEKHYLQFEDSEENKLSYTDIHKAYVQLVETFLVEEISKRTPDFSMQEFIQTLTLRKDELDGEVFDLLLTFSDFVAFKELVLDFRADKEGRTVDLSGGLKVIPMQSHFALEGDGLCLMGHNLRRH
ncbi:ADP-ribosylation factor-like protein 2-binding protein [Babylonia areolata]|uniref:ADP-ribosylation factor-like protein 2-binding protein n=1 Tax=Babylonia areolata TaxID=304850 RepID=UPI003FD423F7